MTVLVDSDVLIEVTRARDAATLERWANLAESDDVVLCTPITVAELWHCARPSEHRALRDLFRAFVCVPLDTETGMQAGEYLRAITKVTALSWAMR